MRTQFHGGPLHLHVTLERLRMLCLPVNTGNVLRLGQNLACGLDRTHNFYVKGSVIGWSKCCDVYLAIYQKYN